MNIIKCEMEQFYNDFLSLIVFLDCGDKYRKDNKQHVEWLRKKISNSFNDYGVVLGAYDDSGIPLGFIWYKHDTGMDGVAYSGKCAHIKLFGLFDEYRNRGIGTDLLNTAYRLIKENGGECLYVDTYLDNKEAIAYYVKRDFYPVTLLPGLNGLDDEPQVLLYKVLK